MMMNKKISMMTVLTMIMTFASLVLLPVAATATVSSDSTTTAAVSSTQLGNLNQPKTNKNNKTHYLRATRQAIEFDACPAGRYFDAVGLNPGCVPVGPGFFSPAIDPLRYACRAGTMSDQDDAEECTPCPPGTHAPEMASQSCTYCDPGTFNHRHGSEDCSTCNDFYYKGYASDFAVLLLPDLNGSPTKDLYCLEPLTGPVNLPPTNDDDEGEDGFESPVATTSAPTPSPTTVISSAPTVPVSTVAPTVAPTTRTVSTELPTLRPASTMTSVAPTNDAMSATTQAPMSGSSPTTAPNAASTDTSSNYNNGVAKDDSGNDSGALWLVILLIIVVLVLAIGGLLWYRRWSTLGEDDGSLQKGGGGGSRTSHQSLSSSTSSVHSLPSHTNLAPAGAGQDEAWWKNRPVPPPPGRGSFDTADFPESTNTAWPPADDFSVTQQDPLNTHTLQDMVHPQQERDGTFFYDDGTATQQQHRHAMHQDDESSIMPSISGLATVTGAWSVSVADDIVARHSGGDDDEHDEGAHDLNHGMTEGDEENFDVVAL